MKEKNIKFTRKLIALLVAGGISMAPIPGTAITNNTYDPGTFVKEADENEPYGKYVVKEGDNASRISEKVCSHLRIEITTKYWPVIAILNDYPRVINPGDIIIFPKTKEELEEIYYAIRKSGSMAKYIQQNNVYKKRPKKCISIFKVSKLLSDMYGDVVCTDPDFIMNFFKYKKLDEKYVLTRLGKFNEETLRDFTESIPTLEELEEYKKEHAPKTKKLK